MLKCELYLHSHFNQCSLQVRLSVTVEFHCWLSLLSLFHKKTYILETLDMFSYVMGNKTYWSRKWTVLELLENDMGWKWWTCFCTFVLKELMHGMVFLWLFGSPMGQASGVLVACRHATHKHINTSKQKFYAAWNPLMDRRDAEPLILAAGVFHFDSLCLSLGFLWVDSGPLPWTSMEMTRQFWPESDPFSLCDSTWVRFNLL